MLVGGVPDAQHGRRELAIVMQAMWRDGTFYVGDPNAEAHEIDTANAAKMQRLNYAQS